MWADLHCCDEVRCYYFIVVVFNISVIVGRSFARGTKHRRSYDSNEFYVDNHKILMNCCVVFEFSSHDIFYISNICMNDI